MQIYIASDHAGFKLKEALRKYLVESGYEVKDFGAFSYNEKDDYPDFIREAVRAVVVNLEHGRGIILGLTGQGEAIMANRFKGVRAVVYYGGSEDIIKFSREHNNANVLALGARFLSEDDAKRVVNLWLKTDFNSEGENERHLRRIKKIDS